MADPVELVEIGLFERRRDLQRAVAAEVEEYDAVAVDDGAHRLPILGDDERLQVLVDGAGFIPQGLDRLHGGRELAFVGQNVGVPPFFHHRPVGLVAVHGDVHAPAAAGNGGVEVRVADFFEESLERLHIIQGRGFRHVAAIQQDMDPDLLLAFLLGAADHRLEVIHVGVHVAVGKQPDEMKRRALVLGVGDDFPPGGLLEHGARIDGVVDQRRTLVEDLAGTKGVVADLGIAHVLVAGHANRHAVGLQHHMSVFLEQPVEGGGVRLVNGVALGVGIDADAVHDDRDHRALDAGEGGMLFEHCVVSVRFFPDGA